ncbi:zinc finger protein 462-like isoform X1 [Arapaima gigas]
MTIVSQHRKLLRTPWCLAACRRSRFLWTKPFLQESRLMEVLQCDGCHFRAESYDDLKAHIQDVHTAFLQPTAVGERSPEQSGPNSLDSLHQGEQGEDHEQAELHCLDVAPGSFTDSVQITHNRMLKNSSKPTSQFFQCKFCIRYFRSKSLLNDHTRKVHAFVGKPSVNEGSSSPAQMFKKTSYSIVSQDDFGKVFSCQYCSYKSPRRARILKHQKMYHKYCLLNSAEAGKDSPSAFSDQEPHRELPEEVVQRSILESMVKPLTKSRGNFSCEWCGYQTLRRERWCDHMMKKHRNMVKVISSLQQDQEGDGALESYKSDSPPSPRNIHSTCATSTSVNGSEDASAKSFGFAESSVSAMVHSPAEQMDSISYEYSQIKTPNSTGASILSDRSTFITSDMSNSGVDFETSSMVDDSRSSSDLETEEINDSNDASPFSGEKQLLSDEDYKMLETKGVMLKRYTNRFKCPFCPFLTARAHGISRHVESTHFSGKTSVYKCDTCSFICTSSFRLDGHKKSHMGVTSEWENTEENQNVLDEPMNGANVISKTSKTSDAAVDADCQNLHCCSICSFTTTTLKGLRVHQQHKHSFCDSMQPDSVDVPSRELHDSEPETYSPSNFVQKTQTSILGYSSKKHFVNKTARKSINDTPLDLSPVKKRTRIDEIAKNLQSKISQSAQQDDCVINVEEMDEEEEENAVLEIENEDAQARQHLKKRRFYPQHCMYPRKMQNAHEEEVVGRQKASVQQKPNCRDTLLTCALSDEEDNENEHAVSVGAESLLSQTDQDSREAFQDSTVYNVDSETLFYCKHCDYHNKSARSVSTHYQRMHPYIKFNFRYILDPEDQSAVFRCLECYVEFTTFDDLNRHYVEHHPEAINVLNFNQPDLVYKCRFCLYTSPNVRSLMPHYQRMHPTVKINNAMIFSSYVVEPHRKESAESHTLREILNSGPKTFTNASAGSKSPACFSSAQKSLRTQDYSAETDFMKEATVNNIVVYDCDICSFASPNMHSVLVHYQKKHPEQKASYFRIQKTMRVVSVERSHSSNNASPDLSSPGAPNASNPIHVGRDEDTFYCKHCVYSNRSVVGVLVHYQKRHPEIKVNAKYIKHAAPTPALMKLMEELQITPPKQFLKSFSHNGTALSSAPRSGTSSDKGEMEMLFFCQHCDYGNRTVKGVLIHYQKKHRDVRTNADLVRRYTAAVRSQRERVQSSTLPNPASATNTDAPRPLRALKCRHCSYTAPYVYALKKHLKKEHPTVKATAMTILRWAYQDGVLGAGYHCEWCIYSHAEPNGLLMHYQRRHPEHNVDYTHMATKLWAGPDSSGSQPGVNSDSKHYRCRDCAFEACSIWDITNHYQAVHPWAIKGDESVLLDIIKGNPALEKTQEAVNEVHASVSGRVHARSREYGQEALDTRGPTRLSFASTSISNNPYRCTVCFSEYNSLHGLLTHYGKKHPGMKVKAADFAQETDINPSSVYKCRHCPYVNSRIHGVLTHYQKRHPQVKVTAEDFADDVEDVVDVNEAEEKYKSQRQGYGAYRCKMCPYSHGTLEKLKVHYEKYHNQPASDMFKHSLEQFSGGLDETQGDGKSADVEEARDFYPAFPPFEMGKDEKHSLFRCQLCKYFCSTRKGIARHYRIKHNNVRAQPEGMNNVFKCSLCSYTNPIRKGLAAHYQKRHDIDAYYTHCLAASKTFGDKPSKITVSTSCSNEGSALSDELRLAVERRKCSLCSFQAFSRKSIISHYIKRHPGVFPKKQHSSKLGRYFTVVYANEPENISGVIDQQTEERSLVEQEDDVEWLPFKCGKCFKLSFNTAELLCMHYTGHHGKDLKRDFSTLMDVAGDGSECYQCSRCDLKFLSLQELSGHLTHHNEDFQKKAERQERRKQLSKHKGIEQLSSKPEKLENHVSKAPVGYRCNFCVEVHPTLRAICNHLRKHVQYGEAKAGHVKQEVMETPVSIPDKGEASAAAVEVEPVDLGLAPVTTEATVAKEAEPGSVEGVMVKQRSAGGHPCRQCDRVLMSRQGLRSHERSHSAMAVALSRREDKYSCQHCHFVSPFRHNLYRHIQSHHGQHKALRCKSTYLSRLKSHLNKAHSGENIYRCLSCLLSFTTISQLKEHSQEAHGETLTLPKLRAAAHTTFRLHRPTPLDEKPLVCLESDREHSSSVCCQSAFLCDYQQGTQSQPLDSLITPTEGLLICEFCELCSDSMETLHRHYHDHHAGKKLYECKDCSFFTSYKSTFMVHMEASHSNSMKEGSKELHCPLCLYHTKVKSNMIDHIVLHREERTVPLEVCRSKLSRHLQGMVFRCHKCTFTCSSDESLKQHLQKHSELKPYKCQLCFYDSRECEELETHLRDEHKVICNFELAGQVNLDQLEAMNGKVDTSNCAKEESPEEEEETKEPEPNDTPSSPGSAASSCGERRFPCQFCGRVFAESTEWERHVLRHGMVVTSSRTKVSHAPAIQASDQSDAVSPVAKTDRRFPAESVEVECDPPSDPTKSQTENVEEEKMQEAKNCP